MVWTTDSMLSNQMNAQIGQLGNMVDHIEPERSDEQCEIGRLINIAREATSATSSPPLAPLKDAM